MAILPGNCKRTVLFLALFGAIAGCGGSSTSRSSAPTPTLTATLTPTATATASGSGQTWNLYQNYSAYYVLPYASPTPAFGTQMGGQTLLVDATICDGANHCANEPKIGLDTGSRGLWIAASDFPTAVPSSQSTPGYIFYNSSGRQIVGDWTILDVSFPMASPVGAVSTPASAAVPVLLVKQVCDIPGDWPEGSNPTPEACRTPPPGVGLMGIGFDRTGYGTCPQGNPTPAPNINPNVPTCGATPAANQNYNPLLNLSAMQDGQMSSGYILTQNGVVLGLTSTNIGPEPGIPAPNTYAFEKLVSSGLTQIPGSPPDWQPATGSIAINGVANPSGQAVIDIGIGDMLIGPATPVASNTPVPAGLSANVALLGLPPGTAGYNFVTGDSSGANPLAPTVGDGASTGANYSPYQQIAYPGNTGQFAFVNTGINVLNGFNYLYDAQNGYLGLQLNMQLSYSFLTPTLSANGPMPFADGFVTNLPVSLTSDSTISTSGTITLNGPISGDGTLTIAGGTVNVNCPSVVTQAVVSSGTLVIGSTITGPITTEGSGRVQHSPNSKCNSLTP